MSGIAGPAPVAAPQRAAGWSHWSLLLGIAVSAAFVAIVLRGVDVPELRSALRDIRGGFLITGFACGLAACWVMGLRWQTLLHAVRPVTAADAVDQVMIGNLAGLLLPARMGDVARVVLMRARWQIAPTRVIGCMVVERLTDVMALLVIATALMPIVALPAAVRVALGTLAVAAMITIVALWIGTRHGAAFFGPVFDRLPGWAGRRARELTGRLIEGWHGVKSARGAIRACAWTGAIWGLSGLALASYVIALRLPVPWYAGAMVLVLTNLGGLVPSAPGAIGVYHYLAMLALSLWGVDKSAALGFAVVSHALTLLATAVGGSYSLTRQGLTLRSLRTPGVLQSVSTGGTEE